MKNHLQRVGIVYVYFLLFAGTAAGQFVYGWHAFAADQTTHHQIPTMLDYWPEFASAVLENWQSEFLQLGFQLLGAVILAKTIFKAGTADLERIEAKIDRLKHNGTF